MPRPTSRPASTRLLLAAVLVAGLGLAGCSQQPSKDAFDVPTTRPARPSANASPSDPSPAATSTAAAPTTSAAPSPTAPARSGPADRLLAGADVPGFNDQFAWTDGPTRSSEPDRYFGTCQRFSMTSIGAVRVAVRAYTPADASAQASAGELVAQFADEKTAASAMDVLRAWRSRCGDQLKNYPDPHVGALEPVDASGADAGWYLLSYGDAGGDPDSRWFDAQGMVRVGTRVALVRLTVLGQDYNYPAGQEPMVDALRRAATRL